MRANSSTMLHFLGILDVGEVLDRAAAGENSVVSI